MDDLRFAAPVELQAAADNPKRPPRVSIVAYSGGEMSPAGWGAIVIDLAGADVTGDVPLLAGHMEDLDSIVGQGHAEVRDGRIVVAGDITRATTAGRTYHARHAWSRILHHPGQDVCKDVRNHANRHHK